MTKRTFVLFLCLLQALALSLFPGQAHALYTESIGNIRTAKQEAELRACTEVCEEICEEECLDNTPIVQANETEWKENFSDLLRHRHSSYRFVTFESVTPVSFHFAVGFRVFCKKIQTVTFFKGVTTLPDYYSFLHRLSPF